MLLLSFILIIPLQVNSYQATIVSDAIRTYAVFSYVCGDIQWSSVGTNRAAVVGYNSEANFFENHPLSGMSEIGNAVSCGSDVGGRRKRQTAQPTNVVLSPANLDFVNARCLRFRATDELFLLGSSPASLAAMLDPCPCTLQQATTDRAKFTRLATPTNCYVSSQPVYHQLLALGRVTLTQMCCYVNG